MESLSIQGTRSPSTEAVSEPVNLAFCLNVHSKGLREIHLRDLDPKTQLVDSSLDRLGSICPELRCLTVSAMVDLNEKARSQLIDLTVNIIAKCSSLEQLTLWKTTERPEEGQRLIEALVGSNLTKITLLDLVGNKTWFAEDPDTALLLFEFVARQIKLKKLLLSGNSFDSHTTEDLFNQLA